MSHWSLNCKNAGGAEESGPGRNKGFSAAGKPEKFNDLL
jgi:hypothetical protein